MSLGSLIETATVDLGLRFNLLGILPSTILFLFILSLYWSGTFSLSVPIQFNAPDIHKLIDNIKKT